MTPEITQRLDHLERTNRLLLWGLLATSIAFMFTWGLMPTRGERAVPSAAEVPHQFDKLVARELSIIDAAGWEVASIKQLRDRGYVELKVGGGSAHATLQAGRDHAHVAARIGLTSAMLRAYGDNQDGIAVVNAVTRGGHAGIVALDQGRLYLGDRYSNLRTMSVSEGPGLADGDGNATKHRPNSPRQSAIARLNLQLALGEISDAEARRQMAEIDEHLPTDESEP